MISYNHAGMSNTQGGLTEPNSKITRDKYRDHFYTEIKMTQNQIVWPNNSMFCFVFVIVVMFSHVSRKYEGNIDA